MSKQKVNCAKGTREADLGHAVLSASGSHRWLNCTPSARLELEFENTTSEAAREGTAAHALCEHKLKKFLKKRSKRPVSDYNSDEMEECTDAYAEFVMEQYEEAKKSCKDPVILIEQKLDFSCYVPEGCRTDFADIQNKKECGGNRQWQRQFLRKWAANTKGKAII